jgi:hypothetical protein
MPLRNFRARNRSIIARHGGYRSVAESVGLSTVSEWCAMSQLQQIPCPNCQSEMSLGQVTPGPLGYDFRIFECHRCSHQLKTAVKLGDPMKSKLATGWLHGQLVPPK